MATGSFKDTRSIPQLHLAKLQSLDFVTHLASRRLFSQLVTMVAVRGCGQDRTWDPPFKARIRDLPWPCTLLSEGAGSRELSIRLLETCAVVERLDKDKDGDDAGCRPWVVAFLRVISPAKPIVV